jgi:hypothetical protein
VLVIRLGRHRIDAFGELDRSDHFPGPAEFCNALDEIDVGFSFRG